MLVSFSSRQTAFYCRFLQFRTSLSTLPYPRSSETQAPPDEFLNVQRPANTFVLPGVPLKSPAPPLASEQSTTKTEDEDERIPSSRFSAFLHSIRSGLPFFPSNRKSQPSTINLATTREHFLPVRFTFYQSI